MVFLFSFCQTETSVVRRGILTDGTRYYSRFQKPRVVERGSRNDVLMGKDLVRLRRVIVTIEKFTAGFAFPRPLYSEHDTCSCVSSLISEETAV